MTAILKRESAVATELRKALESDHTIVICSVVYEVKRGLLHVDAKGYLGFFEEFVSEMQWRDLKKADWNEASQIWADRMKSGNPLDDDADILISAVARLDGAAVVTRNIRHFSDLGLNILSWN